MSLSVDTNLYPLSGPRSAAVSATKLDGRLERLPDVQPIDRIADPAVVVSISAPGISANRNPLPAYGIASGGLSLLQTASSAIGSVESDLTQIRTLALLAANARSAPDSREMLQLQVMALADDIDRIAGQTQFNGIRVFDQGTSNMVGDPSLRKVLDGLQGGWLENAEKLIQNYYGLKADGASLDIDLTGMTDGPYGVAARVTATAPSSVSGKGSNLRLQLDRANFVPANLPNGGVAPVYSDRIIAHEMTHAVLARTTNYVSLTRDAIWFVEGIAEFIHGGDERFAYDLVQAGGEVQSIVNALDDGMMTESADYSASYAAVRYLHAQIKAAGGAGIKDVMAYLSTHQSRTLDDAFREAIAPLGGPVSSYTSMNAFLRDFKVSGADFIAANFVLTNADTGAIGGYDVDGGPVRTAESVIPDTGYRLGENVLAGFNERFEKIPAGGFKFAAGAINRGVAAPMNAKALGVNALNLLDDPTDAIGQAERAIRYVNVEQARINTQLIRFDAMFANFQSLFAIAGGTWSPGFFSPAQLAALIGSGMQAHPDIALRAQANVDKQNALGLLRGDALT